MLEADEDSLQGILGERSHRRFQPPVGVASPAKLAALSSLRDLSRL